MEQQAGIYKITLYENKDVSFYYSDKYTISNITNTGEILTIENSDCDYMDLNFETEQKRSDNNILLYKNTITYKLLGQNNDNIDTIIQLKTSIYQWLAVLEFYDGTKKIIINPLRFEESDIDNSVSNHFNITLKNSIFGKRLYNYVFAPLDGIGVWQIENTFIIQ